MPRSFQSGAGRHHDLLFEVWGGSQLFPFTSEPVVEVIAHGGAALNPVALRLKELETLEKITEKIDRISVYGGLESLLKQVTSLKPGA